MAGATTRPCWRSSACDCSRKRLAADSPRPDSPFVVFYGEPSESHDAELKGKLVLNNPESLSVRSVRITLTATRKVS